MTTNSTSMLERTVATAAAIAAIGVLGLSGGSASARIDVPTPYAERTSAVPASPDSNTVLIASGRCPHMSLRYVVACAW